MSIFLVLTLLSQAVFARMYQWVEPDTGTTQFSGKPPAWYRSENGGPRVFVFDNGRLIDDTNVAVDEEVRLRMRQKAFILAEEDRQAAREKLAKAQEIKDKMRSDLDAEAQQQTRVQELDEGKEEVELKDEFFSEPGDSIKPEDQTFDGKSLEELRQIITDWEQSQTESARKALE